MAQQLFKISFLVLLGTIWPGSISAETLRLTTTNPNLTVFQKMSNSYQAGKHKETRRDIRWKKYKLKLCKMLFQKRKSEDGEMIWWFLGVGLLLLIFWGLIVVGLIWLASFVNIWIIVLLSIIILGCALFGLLVFAVGA